MVVAVRRGKGDGDQGVMHDLRRSYVAYAGSPGGVFAAGRCWRLEGREVGIGGCRRRLERPRSNFNACTGAGSLWLGWTWAPRVKRRYIALGASDARLQTPMRASQVAQAPWGEHSVTHASCSAHTGVVEVFVGDVDSAQNQGRK